MSSQSKATELVGVMVPPEFKVALFEACATEGQIPSKVLRRLLADFVASKGITLEYDESVIRAGMPAGMPPKPRRRNRPSGEVAIVA